MVHYKAPSSLRARSPSRDEEGMMNMLDEVNALAADVSQRQAQPQERPSWKKGPTEEPQSPSSSPATPLPPGMDEILRCPANRFCADCSNTKPLWTSFLIPRVEVDKKLGVVVCEKCAQHHYFQLGEKRCRIKFLGMVHEWTKDDTEIIRYSGNSFVNAIYEAKLEEEGFDKFAEFGDDQASSVMESIHRAKFIKYKYKKRKFMDEVVYYQKMLELLLGKQPAEPEEEDERSTVSEPNKAVSRPLQEDERSAVSEPMNLKRSARQRSIRQNGSRVRKTRVNRCASMGSPHINPLQGGEHDAPAHINRRRSDQSTPLHKLGRTGSNQSLGLNGSNHSRGPSRRHIGVVSSPKREMRNRRLGAIACIKLMDLDLPAELALSA